MKKIFNLKPNNIKNLDLKLDGKLPIDRDELLALVNSWGRNQGFYTKDKDNNEILIDGCESKEKYDLSKLDVSEISNFDKIFFCSEFNCNINSWNVSNATSMHYMFANTKKFNSPLDKWNTSNVTNMNSIFAYAIKFNQNINMWNVSKVEKMCFMFSDTKEFNQPLDKWDISNVTSINAMFYRAENFNQNLNSWDISKVINMDHMFANTKKFNQPISWDLSNVKSCVFMFDGAKAFEEKFCKVSPYYTINIKKWLKDNQERMIALNVEYSKGKELDNFLLNLNYKNGIYNGKI